MDHVRGVIILSESGEDKNNKEDKEVNGSYEQGNGGRENLCVKHSLFIDVTKYYI